jgi:predicted dehydrogenase
VAKQGKCLCDLVQRGESLIRIAVIGCGYWGPNLIRNFVTCPETELLWACDIDKKRLEKVLGPYPPVRRTTDLQDIIGDDRVDAVAIATPVHTHFPIAEACLKSGKHVLVEKPLASSVAQGEKLPKREIYSSCAITPFAILALFEKYEKS